MNRKNPLVLRILAWCVGGYLCLMFLLLHALMLVAGIEDNNVPHSTDWIFIVVFLLLLERVFHALRARLRGLRKAGQIFRTFLGVSAFLGLTSPLSMVLAFLRVGLREPVSGMGAFIYYFFAFWGVVVGLVCFFARYLFEKPPARGQTPSSFPDTLRPESVPLASTESAPPRPPAGGPQYTLLQVSLDQEIPSEALKAASKAIPSICEADCDRICREAFGILVSGLSEEDATRFQQSLRGHGIQTLRLARDELFPLPGGRLTRDLRWEGDALVETDAVGRELRLTPKDCAFIAAGRIQDRIRKEESKIVREKVRQSVGRNIPHVEMVPRVVRTDVWEAATLFRIEFILLREPYRIYWQSDPARPGRLDGAPVRMREPGPLHDFLSALAQWLPPEQSNRGLADLAASGDFTYPSLSAFEEETVWTLTRKPPST